jgi:hypothetical protein
LLSRAYIGHCGLCSTSVDICLSGYLEFVQSMFGSMTVQ